MKPAAFEYARVETCDEAVALLAEHGDDAKLIAGGQSLMPMLNFRVLAPEVLVDIGGVETMQRISVGDDGLCIGAAATRRFRFSTV